MHQFRAPLSTVLLLAAFIAGCGGGGGSGDVSNIKQTVTRELAAIADGDGATACSLATAGGRAKLTKVLPGASCEKVIQLVSKRLPANVKQALHSAQVKKVTVDGDRATVRDEDISSTSGSLSGFLKGGSGTSLAKQSDGSWKISG